MTRHRETGSDGDARADQGVGGDAGRGSAEHRAASSEGASGPSGNRRQFLKTISLPPVAVALAGCPLGGSSDGEATTGTFTPPDLSEGDSTRFEETIRFGDAYAMVLERTGEDGTEIAVSGRFQGADHHLEIDLADSTTETYVVDGDTYFVADGTCTRYPGVASVPGDVGAVGVVPEDPSDYPELTFRGSVTRAGEEFLQLVLPADALEGFEDPLTYYVDPTTYYLRRLETAAVAVDYHSWGEVDPIEPPAMDCSDAT